MGSMKDAFGDRPYPVTPGFKEPTTSKDAARSINGRAAQLRNRAFAAIAAAGRSGISADEVAAAIGETVLAVRPRITELLKRDKIEPTGERRKNASGASAAVWRVYRAG